MAQDQGSWDAIVIGSGMGGLACAAALARTGHAVLVLEQHYVAGGLTQTFHRNGFRWDVGVHYVGEMGPEGEGRAILDWLAGGGVKFASMGAVYDVVHFPDDFELQFPRTEGALRAELKERFPASSKDIDAFFGALAKAERAGMALFALRVMPGWLAKLYGLWRGGAVRKWWGRSSAQVLDELVSDPKLRAVLMAQGANYGALTADQTSFGVQALVTRHYFNGAYYPVGTAKAFAEALVPAIEQAGGAIRLKAKVRELVIEKGAVVGVALDDATEIRAPRVFSDAGAHNTVAMLPPAQRQGDWAREILSFAPSPCHVVLYLGLQGDIRANGASAANHWFHETWDVDPGDWRDPAGAAPPPVTFMSFPSLKDPAHQPGDKQRHTAEIVAPASWSAFAAWRDSKRRERPEDYTTFKAAIARNLLAEFARRFPALAPMVVAHEASTPLTTLSFTGAVEGGVYGLEVSPRRFLSHGLRAKTPIPGLYLAGQDVVTPGVTGAMMGGAFAAAAIEPKVLPHLR